MSTGPAPGLALAPLLTGIGVMLLLTAYPHAVVDASGRVDHIAVLCLAWSMSAGFVRGVGFVPHHPVPRWGLSGLACVGALVLAVLRLWRISG